MADDTRVTIGFPGGQTIDTTVEGMRERLAFRLGHNSGDRPTMADTASTVDVLNGTAQTQLKTILERIERLEEDKAAVMADLKEVYAEAKGVGFDTKILRKVSRILRMDRAKRQEEDALIDLYLSVVEGIRP